MGEFWVRVGDSLSIVWLQVVALAYYHVTFRTFGPKMIVSELIPNILFIIFNFEFCKKLLHFLFKIYGIVMLRLKADVVFNFFNFRFSNRKYTITILPPEVFNSLGFYPSRRIGFYFVCQFRYC